MGETSVDYRDVQKRLLESEQNLKTIQEELNNKEKELNNLRNNNENEKSNLINELIQEIEALRENAKAYEQQITSIKKELNDVREHIDTIDDQLNGVTKTSNYANSHESTNTKTTQKNPVRIVRSDLKKSEQTTNSDKTETYTNNNANTNTSETNYNQSATTESDTYQNTQTQSNTQTQNTQNKPYETSTYQENNFNTMSIQSVEGYILKTDELLQNIKEIKTGTSKKGLTQAGKNTMDDAKVKLKQYEDNLKGKKKHLLEWQGAEIYDSDISDIQFIENQLSIVKLDIAEGQRGNYSSRAAYLYNSPENAKKGNKRQEKAREFNTKFTELTRDGAILNIFNRNLEQTRKYLQRIAEGNYTYADYQIYTNNSAILTPRFNRYGIMIPVDPRYNQGNGGETKNNATNVPGVSVVDASGNTVENNVRTVEVGEQKQSVDYSNMDRSETFQQGGLGGLLDKALCHTNMTPGQKDTWKSLGILGGFAAGIFGLYKFFTNSNRSLWAKAGITAAAIFGTQALTGEGPISLFNKLMTGGLNLSEYTNKFGSAVASIGLSGSNQSSSGTSYTMGTSTSSNTNTSSETSTTNNGTTTSETSTSENGDTMVETVKSAMYSMMIFNSNTKVKDIDEITQSFKTNNENRIIFYNQSCQKLQKEYGQKAMESFQATFTPQFDEQKWGNRLASFGITNTTNRNESIYGLANNATMNETILEKFKTENGLKDNGSQDLKDYINNKKKNNQPIDVDDLNYHINDWFKVNEKATYTERVEDINNRKIIVDKIKNLSISPEKKEKLIIDIQEFYNQRSILLKPNPNEISFSIENGLLIFKTHGGEGTKIDLNKNEIIGFGQGISFPNIVDLLNTADLANKTLSEYKNKIPKDLPPFNYDWTRKGIYFNDADNIRQDIIKRNYSGRDDRVIKTGRWGDTSKIDTLYDHPGEFAKYLSDRRLEGYNRIINISSYPIINGLSELGITFLNIEEAKKAETRLKKVKETQKQCDQGTAPFSIDGKKLVFSTSYKKNTKKIYFPDTFPDNFSGKTQDLSSFPTLLKNKTIFLKYMNNKNNNMR